MEKSKSELDTWFVYAHKGGYFVIKDKRIAIDNPSEFTDGDPDANLSFFGEYGVPNSEFSNFRRTVETHMGPEEELILKLKKYK